MIIDTHAHVVPATLLDAMRTEKRLFPSVKLHDAAAPRMEFAAGGPGRPIQPRLHDLAQRRDWLKKAQVDHQLVGGWTDVYGYDLPPEEGADWARFYNEHMAQDAAAMPALSALATVPLQDGALAAKVLEEALDAGFRGAMIATQPKGVGGNLDDKSLDPFWEIASARNAAIFLHPHYICSDDRLDGYDLVNAVGRLDLKLFDKLVNDLETLRLSRGEERGGQKGGPERSEIAFSIARPPCVRGLACRPIETRG